MLFRSVIISLSARDTSMMTKYPVCQNNSHPSLPKDTCAYQFSSYIPSTSPVTTIPYRSFYHHRRHPLPHAPTPSPSSSSSSLPTGCPSTPPSIPAPPLQSASLLPSPISLHNQGNGGCTSSNLFSCFILLTILTYSMFLLSLGAGVCIIREGDIFISNDNIFFDFDWI